MGIAITNKGNVYETTSKGKLGAMAIGAGAGGFWAHKNVDLIKDTADKYMGNFLKEVGSSTLDVAKGGFSGTIDAETVKKNLKFNGKITKYVTKVFNAVKKHPVAIGAAVGAVALLAVGAVCDCISNAKRANKADLPK